MGKGGRPGLFSKPEDPVSMGHEGQISFALAEKLGPLGFEVCSLPCDAMVMPHRGPWCSWESSCIVSGGPVLLGARSGRRPCFLLRAGASRPGSH